MSLYRMRYRTTQDLSKEWLIERDAPSAAELAKEVRKTHGAIYILELEEATQLKRLTAAPQNL